MTAIRTHYARAVDQSGDRNHVKKDLDAYICVSDNCTEPYQLYSSSEEWLAHISSQHRTRWHCTARDHRPILFETRQQFMDHMEVAHPRRFGREQLGFVADSCARALAPTIPNCPFCSESAGNLDAHVRQHLHYFALQSLPWPEDSTRDTDHASINASDNSSTSEGLDRATLRDSFDDSPRLHGLMQDFEPPPLDIDISLPDLERDIEDIWEAAVQETNKTLLSGDDNNVTEEEFEPPRICNAFDEVPPLEVSMQDTEHAPWTELPMQASPPSIALAEAVPPPRSKSSELEFSEEPGLANTFDPEGSFDESMFDAGMPDNRPRISDLQSPPDVGGPPRRR